MTDEACGCLVLAAGNSSRMGQVKALLPYRGATMIEHVIMQMSQVSPLPVMVVTGAVNPALQECLRKLIVTKVANPYWQEGMASSIRTGLARLLEMHPGVSGALFAACDQPFVSAALFQEMIACKKRSGKGIVACAYADTVGIPAVFDKCYFTQLLALEGKEGAKKLLRLYADDVADVVFAKGSIDIDTPEDYDDLMQKERK